MEIVFWVNVLRHGYCCHGDSVLLECSPPWLLLPWGLSCRIFVLCSWFLLPWRRTVAWLFLLAECSPPWFPLPWRLCPGWSALALLVFFSTSQQFTSVPRVVLLSFFFTEFLLVCNWFTCLLFISLFASVICILCLCLFICWLVCLLMICYYLQLSGAVLQCPVHVVLASVSDENHINTSDLF